MVGPSKILTVSYGTFSCTLEGFDDSFSTMKAIAEYFRDLAADDRYFGAEPATPDADMLAKIAEREIARRVEARTSENGNGIVLRAAAIGADTAPSEAAVISSEITASDTAATVTPTMPPAVQRPAPEAVAAAPFPIAHATSEETPSSLLADSDTAMGRVDQFEETSEGLSFDDMADVPVAPAISRPHPDAESVAAKLQRIRAVAGKPAPLAEPDAEDLTEAFVDETPETEAFVAEDFSDDMLDAVINKTFDDASLSAHLAEDADMSDATPNSDEADEVSELDDQVNDAWQAMMSDIEADSEADPATENESDKDDASAPLAFDNSSLIADLLADETDVVSAPSEPQVEDQDDDGDITDLDVPKVPSIRARIVRLKRAILPETKTEAQPFDMPEESFEPEEIPSDDDTILAAIEARAAERAAKAAAELAATSTDQAEDDGFESEIDDAFDGDDLAAYGTMDDDGGFDDATDDADTEDQGYSIAALDGVDDLTEFDDVAMGSLSPEDEADLMRELAEVEAEAEVTRNEQSLRKHSLPANDDAVMARIDTQVDEELSEPEGSRRRNAIAQLKAAVAATEAARQLGDARTDDKMIETAFRNDLSEVVSPRRPTRPVAAGETRSERPRPAPLKLVASQRVDTVLAPSDAAPVQPRRVAVVAPSTATSDASSFADFAAEMGATDLPDLLEAAAAYTAFVEGLEDFSRPQIMQKVQQSADRDFSREDGLRSFGTLLRQGRISKVRNGRFQVSDQTRFRPEQQVARG